MGKMFWIALCGLCFSALASIFVAYSVEEHRWHSATTSTNDLVKAIETRNEKRDEMIKMLRRLDDEINVLGMEVSQQQKKKAGKIAMDAIMKLNEGEEDHWDIVLGVQKFFNQKRKTNLQNLLFSTFLLVFTVFVAIAAAKTKKRLLKEVVALAIQRDELNHREKSLKISQDQIEKSLNRIVAESQGVKELREIIGKERRQLDQDTAIFQLERQQIQKENAQAARDKDHAREMLEESRHIRQKFRVNPNTTEKKVEVFAATLAPWKFWVTFSQNDKGQELPQEKDRFAETLQLALDKAGYQGLDARLIYSKLLLLTKNSEKRQRIKRIRYKEPREWSILRVGKKYRLFLLIEEEAQEVRFMPCSRKDSYLNH